MPFHYQRPQSVAATWSRRLGRFALLLAVMAVLLHRIDMLSLPNAVAAILLATGLAMLVFGLALIGFAMLWLIGARGGHASFSGLVMALLVLAPVGVAASRYVQLPAIHDVSTDVDDPPQWLEPPPVSSSWLPRSDGDSAGSRQSQSLAYPRVTGRRYDGAIDRVLLAVRAAAAQSKWTEVDNVGVGALVDTLEEPPEDEVAGAPNAETNGEADPARAPLPQPRPELGSVPQQPLPTAAMIQYRTSTLVLGIPQDVVIRLSEEEETTFVDMRAATRDGDHDLGLNAELVQQFLRDLDVRLLGIAGG